ncbi:MAG: hypothetical protein JXB39_14685 [Deltaproteobacteria bacterium]|nr:hypothetical protein [Deltaproteobacteria bacterium]
MKFPFPALALVAACLPEGHLYRTDGFRIDRDSGDDTPSDDTGENAGVLSIWQGERVFAYDYGGYGCVWGTDTVTEEGTRLTRSDPEFDRIQGRCPKCQALYKITVSPDQVCGWIAVSTCAFRGLVFGEDSVAVWRLDIKGDLLDPKATWDGHHATYRYEDSAWFGDNEVPLDICGSVTVLDRDAR